MSDLQDYKIITVCCCRTVFVEIYYGSSRTTAVGVCGATGVTPEWEGPGVAFCYHRKRTNQKGAWGSMSISAVPLGSEDRPASLKRQILTLLLRTLFVCPR